MHTSELQVPQRLLELQGIAGDLHSSISRHSQLLTAAAPLDLGAVLKYAHKIAYTSFAPLGHDHSQPLPQHFRPPNPQEWQLQASQLHQFQAEHAKKQQEAQAAAQAAAGVVPAAASQLQASAAPQLPPGLKIPSMPKGWKPGMPIPGLEAATLLPPPPLEPAPPTAPTFTQPEPMQHEPQVLAVAAQPAAPVAPLPATEPQQHAPPAEKAAALLPHPIIPDFELNPGMEAVEEEFSSSEGDEDD